MIETGAQRPSAVHHAGFTVRSFDHIVALLVDLFAAKLEFRGSPADPTIVARITGIADARAQIAMLDLGSCRIELLQYGRPSNRCHEVLRPCDSGHAHIAFECNAIDEIVHAARRYGFELSAPVAIVETGPNKGRRAAYLHDEQGFVLELLARPIQSLTLLVD